MVGVAHVGVVSAAGIYAGKTGAIDSVAVGVVDTLPYVLVVLGSIVYGVDIVVTDRVPAPTALKGDFGLAALTLLGGDEHHAVGTTRTVEGGRGGVLEDRDRSDIVGVELREGVLIGRVGLLGHTVDDDKGGGRGAVGGAYTTDAHSHIITRLAVDRRHADTWGGTLERTAHGGGVLHGDVLGLDGGHRTGKVFLLLGTVCHNDNFVEDGLVFFQSDVDNITLGSESLLLIADGAHSDARARLDLEAVVTVGIGDGGVGGIANLGYSGADDGLAVGILHQTGYGFLGLLYGLHCVFVLTAGSCSRCRDGHKRKHGSSEQVGPLL